MEYWQAQTGERGMIGSGSSRQTGSDEDLGLFFWLHPQPLVNLGLVGEAADYTCHLLCELPTSIISGDMSREILGCHSWRLICTLWHGVTCEFGCSSSWLPKPVSTPWQRRIDVKCIYLCMLGCNKAIRLISAQLCRITSQLDR